ncbi:MAG TPA: APC family permease [Chloroflexota bacterium]|jgi:amino acid transporter
MDDSTASDQAPRSAGRPTAVENGSPPGTGGRAADHDLTRVERAKGTRPGDEFVRVSPDRDFRRVRRGHLVPREGVGDAKGGVGGALTAAKRFLVGRPIRSEDEPHERVNVFTGLAVFASDNISSSAYATEEIMRVLVLAGLGMLALTLPITVAICLVLAVVVISYQQTIRAYPNGGGSYIVASDNLGTAPALVAAAALLTDYVLTVSVSVAAGVAALTSVFPGWFDYRVAIGIGFVVVLCLGNLRGIRESGAIFTAPTYVYLIAMFGLLAYGLFRYATGSLPPYEAPAAWRQAAGTEALGLLLVLRAFASGSVALTGTEAVSNGVPAFKPPEWRNAQRVLIMMGAFFALIFLGISFLAGQLGILPDPTEQETVISQLTRTLVGEGTPYHYLIQVSTALLLVLAANTAFADFPRLASILARDRFLPRPFQFRGERLAFNTGIVNLALIAAALIVLFQGSVTNLIPLYTVGVFVAFTISQTGMVQHWRRLRAEEPGWRRRAVVNGLGALTTGVVAVEVALSKFALGAWMVLILIPALIGVMWAIRQHYARLEGALRPETPIERAKVRPRAIVPVARLNVPAQQALAFAGAIAGARSVAAVHVADSGEEARRFRAEWEQWPHEADLELVVIESPFRSLSGPLLSYIDAVGRANPEDTIVVVLPEFVPGRWWEHLLHNQTALRLKAALLFHPGVIVANVPYHLARTG